MNFAGGYVGDSSDLMKIRRFEKQREDRLKQIDELKRMSSSSLVPTGTGHFLNSKCPLLEQKFGEETAGLVTKAEFIEKRKTFEEKVQGEERKCSKIEADKRFQIMSEQHIKKIESNKSKLSFCEEEDDEDLDSAETKSSIVSNKPCDQNHISLKKTKDNILKSKKLKVTKNPDVDTSFLPDYEREKEEERERERLTHMWLAKQEEIKKEPLNIVYSYWDGTGHRKKITVRKGDTIGKFLSAVQKQLAPDFEEIRTSSSSHLMYIKEDSIIPQHSTFYELNLNKTQGKSGLLFDFGVEEELYIQSDTTKEKAGPHLGKVVERHWYEKNKHIFPASGWEVQTFKKDMSVI